MNGDRFATPVELKFASEDTGEFEGYGAVYDNVDGHGDVIVPGAFADSIAQHKAQGTSPALYIEHGPFMGGDKLPIGVWKSIEEDERGLLCKGKISGLNTERGRTFWELMKDGALKGLSVAFRVNPNGAVYGKQPKRTLKSLSLFAIDLVTTPANAMARVEMLKSDGGLINPEGATIAISEAMVLFEETLSGGNAPTAEQRAMQRKLLQDAHEHLTGRRTPPGLKSRPNTIREVEALLRESGLSNAEARAIAEHGFKSSSAPRDEEDAKAAAQAEMKSAAEILQRYLDGF